MAMDKSSANTYVYAKASGMLAKSYIGKRASLLFSVRTLGELWSLLFKKEVPVIPENLLARELEKEAGRKFISQYTGLLKNYEKPSPVLLKLLQSFDFENLKDIAFALSQGKKDLPELQEIEPYNILNYSAWPDVKKMTAASSLSWYNRVFPAEDQVANDDRIDAIYMSEMLEAVNSIKTSCKADMQALFYEKIKFENFLWALRLRIYYNMSKDDILSKLFYGSEGKSSSFASMALKSFSWDIDNYDAWKKWEFSYLLNPYEDGSIWNVDPVWISNAYKKHYVKRAHSLFHRHPFTECPLICWFIIKRNELDLIRTASESLRLNVGAAQAMKAAGIQEEYDA